MANIHYLTSALCFEDVPTDFPSPFDGIPHQIACLASNQLKKSLNNPASWSHDFNLRDGGKMFGVLVVRDNNSRIGYLSAFSGMLAGKWIIPGFVPPVFNVSERESYLLEIESSLQQHTQKLRSIEDGDERRKVLEEWSCLNCLRDEATLLLKKLHLKRKKDRRLKREVLKKKSGFNEETICKDSLIRLSFESQEDRREKIELISKWHKKLSPLQRRLDEFDKIIEELKEKRAGISRESHLKIFSDYQLINSAGGIKKITEFFYQKLPPAGSGDCAAPKLIQYAHQQELVPLALAEFWWGASPSSGVRHHGHYYPSCKGKCGPILPFMLEGIEVQAPPVFGDYIKDGDAPTAVYEDEYLVIVNKPSGLLSVPGKVIRDSVQTRLQHRYPYFSGLLLVHRLDMATSGLMLIAKQRETHKLLQEQFLKRGIEKRYVAVLSIGSDRLEMNNGVINLPLRVDLDDRPRQQVCFDYGKPSKTRWELIEKDKNTARVYLYPLSGRTHQLRVHAAHRDGLHSPIVGDALYGVAGERLLLHAERLRFVHPVTGRFIDVTLPAPF